MSRLTIKTEVTLTDAQIQRAMLHGLYRLLGGETIEGGMVMTDTMAGLALYSPTWMPVREATEIDQKILDVIQHIEAQARKGAKA